MKISGKIFLALFCLSLNFILPLYAFGGDIAIYGDSQHNPEIQKRLVQIILTFKPSIVFRVGDIVDNGNDPKQWKAFNDIHSLLLKTTGYFPALGNHEHDSPLYFENFPFLQNRRWYSVDREGIHFIILDSNSDLSPGSEQLNWLKSDLDNLNDSINYKIVLFHHPLFDVGRHNDDEQGLRPVLLPLFEQYGINAVFSGNDHNYQRFEYQGIYFIVTGGGGSHLYHQSRSSPYLKKFIKAYHFCLLSPGDTGLRIKVVDTDLRVIDDFTIPARVYSYK